MERKKGGGKARTRFKGKRESLPIVLRTVARRGRGEDSKKRGTAGGRRKGSGEGYYT